MRNWALWLIVAALGVVIGLTFAVPQLMVAPGPLIPAHAAIATDCFACHVPFRGVSADRCVTCHKVADIGIRTTKGAPVKREGDAIPFHQSLIEPNCLACHSDHSGPRLVKASRPAFAHDLLKPDVRTQCATCHRAPATPLHVQAGKDCASCHNSTAWKPTSFDHSRFFALAGPHNVACATCHTGGNFARYTCFGCHEHQPDQIRARHVEEGIRNIENCARCHRSGSGEGGDGRKGGGDD